MKCNVSYFFKKSFAMINSYCLPPRLWLTPAFLIYPQTRQLECAIFLGSSFATLQSTLMTEYNGKNPSLAISPNCCHMCLEEVAIFLYLVISLWIFGTESGLALVGAFPFTQIRKFCFTRLWWVIPSIRRMELYGCR